MAINNRTEVKTAIDAALVPTLTLAQLKTLEKDELADSTVYRKDIIGSETPGGGTVTIDYSNKDTATATTSGDLTVSFSNLENGDVKFLEITKDLTDIISFSGTTYTTNFSDYIDKKLTKVLYIVLNKNGTTYVFAISKTIDGIYIDADGNLAIGTITPTNLLDVLIASNGEGISITHKFTVGEKVLNLTADGGAGVAEFFDTDGSTITCKINGRASANSYINTSGGNFGVNKTTPNSKLAVVGLPAYGNNADALTGGLTAGDFYQNQLTGTAFVHVVNAT